MNVGWEVYSRPEMMVAWSGDSGSGVTWRNGRL